MELHQHCSDAGLLGKDRQTLQKKTYLEITSDQQELQAHSLPLMHQVENKHILFLKANITRPTKDPEVSVFIADLESSEIKISGLIVPFMTSVQN